MNALRLIAPLALVAPVFAGTWIVDDDGGPGVDFTDIQPAIDAALPGDVIRVFPGVYSGFTLDEPLVLVGAGSGNRQVTGSIDVSGIGLGQFAVVTDLECAGTVDVSACPGVVVLDSFGVDQRLELFQCADVRVSNSAVDAPQGSFPVTSAVQVEESRLELVGCSVQGGKGGDAFGSPDPGGTGLAVWSSGEAHAYRSTLVGGDGGDQVDPFDFFTPSGNGGAGVGNSGRVLMAGESQHGCFGGYSGNGNVPGNHGIGYFAGFGSEGRSSGVTISSSLLNGGTLQEPSPADPTLHTLGTPAPAQVTTFRVVAPTGSTVQLNLGRFPDLVPVGDLEEDVLVKTVRTLNMGAVGASGVASLNFNVPGYLPQGFVFFAQARVTLPGGATRYTNSVPVVLR